MRKFIITVSTLHSVIPASYIFESVSEYGVKSHLYMLAEIYHKSGLGVNTDDINDKMELKVFAPFTIFYNVTEQI